MRWFRTGKMLPVEAEVDARANGALKFVIEGLSPLSGKEMTSTFTGSFREVIEGERLCFDWSVAGDPGGPTLVTVEFRDVLEKRKWF